MKKFMYMPSNNKYGNIKVIARDEDLDAMLKMGWVESPAKLEKYVEDGDKGSGEPGTYEWDKVHILQFSSNKSVVAHVHDVTAKVISHRGKLENVKKNALKALKAHYDNG